jgi:predicted DNA-binding WGR domain protein
MKYHLTFKDNKSDKFWQIETSGKSFTVTYGKTGTAGTSQTKTFDTDEECLKEAEKLLKEKLMKGYDESARHPKPSDYLNNWKTICEATDWQKALINHFQYLVDTPGIEKAMTSILEAILKQVQKISCNMNALTLTFPTITITASPPMADIPEKYPSSYQNLLTRHKTIQLSNYWIELGAHGNFNIDDGWFDDMDDKDDALMLEFSKAQNNLVSPIDDGTSGNYWLYHPSKKNASGEPVIYYLEHDGMEFKYPQSYNAGTLFLIQLASCLGIPAMEIINNDPQSWWGSLDQEWKKILAQHGIQNSGDVIKAWSLRELSIGSESQITTIEPLRSMVKLEKLVIQAPFINDISPLADVSQLTELSISSSEVEDISALNKLRHLKKLNLSGSSVKNLKPLADIFVMSLKLNDTPLEVVDELSALNYHHLYHLEMSNTKVEDLSQLKRFTNVKILNISGTQVMSLEFLSEWSLDKIQLDGTAITSLKPLDSHFLSHISFYNTPVTFEDAVRFRSTTSWWCQLRCNFEGRETFSANRYINWPDFNSVVADWVDAILVQIADGRWSYGGAYEIKNDTWSKAEDENKANSLLRNKKYTSAALPPDALSKLMSINSQLEYKKDILHTYLPGDWVKQLKRLSMLDDMAFIVKVEAEMNKSLTSAIAGKNLNEGKRLFSAYLEVLPLFLNANAAVFFRGVDVRQSIAANGILLLLRERNIHDLVRPLIPKIITEPELARSLAQLHLVNNEKNKMLEHIKRAIYLGCDKENFLSNPDFKAFKIDPDFLWAVNSEKLEELFYKSCKHHATEGLSQLILDLPLLKGKPQLHAIVSQLYNTFIDLIKTSKLTDAKKLLTNYLSVIPEIGHATQVVKGSETGNSFSLREAFASNALVLGILSKDNEVLEMTEKFIPEIVTDHSLAFNLACFHALRQDKIKMLHFIRMAVNLGKKREQFMADSDFDSYKNDPEFLAVFT